MYRDDFKLFRRLISALCHGMVLLVRVLTALIGKQVFISWTKVFINELYFVSTSLEEYVVDQFSLVIKLQNWLTLLGVFALLKEVNEWITVSLGVAREMSAKTAKWSDMSSSMTPLALTVVQSFVIILSMEVEEWLVTLVGILIKHSELLVASMFRKS